jgi:hypothetical protein
VVQDIYTATRFDTVIEDPIQGKGGVPNGGNAS